MRLTPAQIDTIKSTAQDVLSQGPQSAEQPIHRIATQEGVRL